MALSDERIRILAQRLAKAMGSPEQARPPLRLVPMGRRAAPAPSLDPVTRASYVKMVRHLARHYQLEILVDQATFGLGSVRELGDEALVKLYGDLEQARECLVDGIPLDDAGLIRPVAQEATQ